MTISDMTYVLFIAFAYGIGVLFGMWVGVDIGMHKGFEKGLRPWAQSEELRRIDCPVLGAVEDVRVEETI